MEKLEYTIQIESPNKNVWETMLQEETYKQWVGLSWPNSSYEGEWKTGDEIRFIGPDGSGTLAELIEVKPYEKVIARHIAVLNPGGVKDMASEAAQGWVGTMESYFFSEKNGRTTLKVVIETSPKWRAMFDEGWPVALKELKRLSEEKSLVRK